MTRSLCASRFENTGAPMSRVTAMTPRITSCAINGASSIGPTRTSGTTRNSGRADPLKFSTTTTSRVRSTSRANEPGSAKRRPRAMPSEPIAATSSPSFATALSTAAPLPPHCSAPASQRIWSNVVVSFSPAICRARRRSASLSLARSTSGSSIATPSRVAAHGELDAAFLQVAEDDASRDAVASRCDQRVE